MTNDKVIVLGARDSGSLSTSLARKVASIGMIASLTSSEIDYLNGSTKPEQGKWSDDDVKKNILRGIK